MAESPQAALAVIRNKLQVILLRADLNHESALCRACTVTVSEILKEIRDLEVFVLGALSQHEK